MEHKPVIVRTYSAGVHFGYLVRRKGKEVELERSRRIWRWSGAWTISEIATAGLDIETSRVAAPVSIVLTEAIEIIDCKAKAVTCLENAKWAEYYDCGTGYGYGSGSGDGLGCGSGFGYGSGA